MNGVRPVVRYLIACDDIQVNPESQRHITLVGLCSTIRSPEDPPFPARHPELCVFVQLTECRGIGDIRIEVAQADSDRIVFSTRTRSVRFGNDPLEAYALSFRIRDCPFPEAGLYWIRLWYNGETIAQQPLLLR